MELSALTIIGARPLRTEPAGGSDDLRTAWLSRLPPVEPGSMSEAYRTFRAEEATPPAPPPPMPVAPPLGPTQTTGQPAVLSGTVPAALAAYGETMEG